MTVETVDKALDDIRGYLFSDGGDIDVVRVEAGTVYVRFQGNCATCSSQETTMSLGVERALRAAFGDAFKGVVSVAPPESAAPAGATLQAVNGLLDLLRPAIKNYGGMVEAVALEGGVCTVQYEGPAPIWVGVRSAIRDKFSDITSVEQV